MNGIIGRLAVCAGLLVVLAGCGVSQEELAAAIQASEAKSEITLESAEIRTEKRLLEHVDSMFEDYSSRMDERIENSENEYDWALEDYYAQINELLDKNDQTAEEAFAKQTARVDVLMDRNVVRMEELIDRAYDEFVALVSPNINMEYAVCESDYWLNALWYAFLGLLDHLAGEGTTLDDVRLYSNGFEFEGDYGVGDNSIMCVLGEDGTWRVKQMADFVP